MRWPGSQPPSDALLCNGAAAPDLSGSAPGRMQLSATTSGVSVSGDLLNLELLMLNGSSRFPGNHLVRDDAVRVRREKRKALKE